MDLPNDYVRILEMVPQPAFAVSEGRIICCNRLCQGYLPDTNAEIDGMLLTGKEEYSALQEGCLCLRLKIADRIWDATVTPLEGGHLFLLDQPDIPAEVRAMSLMGSQLRHSIATLSLLANRSMGQSPEAEAFRHEISRIHRMLNNAANTERYLLNQSPAMAELDICAVLRELAEEAAVLLAQAGLCLKFTLPPKPVIALADEQGLRQAVYNLLSNAAKYSPAGGTISCVVTHSGSRLNISIVNQGEGIPSDQRSNLFSSFSRQSSLEEGRKNLGLGLALVRAVATMHSGTVLLDSPQTGGTRVTLSLSLRHSNPSVLRSPVSSILVPSANEGLIMLADVLPHSAYSQPL